MDIKLGDTFTFAFTTRAFATGIPTTLVGTPVLSVKEEGNDTVITAGVSVDIDTGSTPITGMHEATVIATGGNGYEADKSYALYISTGTVGGVSVVGEVILNFTVESAPVNWAKVSSPTTAVDLSATDIALCDLVTNTTTAINLTTNNDKTGYSLLATGADLILASSTFSLAIADAIWDELLVGHVIADSTGLLLNDWQDAGRLDAILDTIAEDTTTDIPALFPSDFSTLIITGGAADSLVQGFLNNTISETTADNIANNFEVLFDNANAVSTSIIDDIENLNATIGAAGAGLTGIPLNLGIVTGILGNANVSWIDGNDRVDVGNWLGTPVTLSGGNPDINVETIDADAITATAIATGAIDADSLASDAVDKIRDGILPTQNIAFDDINFLFVDSTDHVTPVTSPTGTGVTRSIDSGAFGAGTGTLAEIGNGIMQYDASAADMNGGKITFRFTASGGTPNAPDDVFITIITGGGV